MYTQLGNILCLHTNTVICMCMQKIHLMNTIMCTMLIYFSSCPFDYVKIHDGATHYTEMMGIYCGRHQNIELFSTDKDLHIGKE